MQTVHIEREIPAAASLVYDYFTKGDLLVRWWPTEAETDPVVGGEFWMYWKEPDVTLRGEYRWTDPGRQLAFTWKWDHQDLPPRLVDVTFEPTPRGCQVRISHDAETDEEVSDYTNGWRHFLERLKQAVPDSA